jgi:hypothetical protein
MLPRTRAAAKNILAAWLVDRRYFFISYTDQVLIGIVLPIDVQWGGDGAHAPRSSELFAKVGDGMKG